MIFGKFSLQNIFGFEIMEVWQGIKNFIILHFFFQSLRIESCISSVYIFRKKSLNMNIIKSEN